VSKRVDQRTIDDLPLFASDEQISEIVMGAGKVNEWLAILPLLERRGFPRIDGLTGGRYVPAVKAFFDREWKVSGGISIADPQSIERLGSWKGKGHRG
jgi:hypothetical protein